MAQNFKRRIALLPNPLTNNENSFKKLKAIDLEEKADNDTFNKSIINKITPKKEKKFEPSLLDTPIIEKKRDRRISIYSPLSFRESLSPKDIPCILDENYFFQNYEISSEMKDSSTKKITNFSHQIDDDNNSSSSFNDFFCYSLKKIKKKSKNKIPKDTITFVDDNNKKYNFHLYDDKNIFNGDHFMNEININYNEHEILDDDDDDENRSFNKNNILKELNNAIYYYSKNPSCISRAL